MAIIDPPVLSVPRTGEIIFRDDPKRPFANAIVGHPTRDLSPPLAEGYRIGARLLAQHAVGNRQDRSYLVWPIVFNYRHHVELVLKRMLLALSELADAPLDRKSQQDLEQHHLGQLWADFKAFAARPEVRAQCSIAIAPDDLAGVDDYIRQLSNVDPDSQTFRYTRGKKGQPLLPRALTHINLLVFSEHMEHLCNFLDCWDNYISEIQSAANEMCSDYSPELCDYGHERHE